MAVKWLLTQSKGLVVHCYVHLVDVPPVLVVFQAFPEHRHNLVAGHHIVGQIGDVSHLRAGWAPWVIRCCLSHLQKKQKMSVCPCHYYHNVLPLLMFHVRSALGLKKNVLTVVETLLLNHRTVSVL